MYYLITGANGRYRLRGSEYTGGGNRTHAQTEENENRGKAKTEEKQKQKSQEDVTWSFSWDSILK